MPIVPDEARTFGMEGLFRQVGIYSSVGQLYTPQDADQLMYYREDKKGQILEEGINEAGAFCSWMAAGTAYANHGVNMIPMYIFYSMFGFQRIGDFAWAAGDMQARGFLLGATAGRTTLAGEGLQHQDGHSHLLASTIPNCVAYDPCFAYELAVIMQDGLRRMYAEQESVFYYITLHERELRAPADAEGRRAGNPARHVPAAHRRPRRRARDAARRRHDPARGARRGGAARVRVRHPGRRVQRHELLASCGATRSPREREALLNPGEKPRQPWVRECLADRQGPFIAATDYMKTVADQIRQWVPGRYVALGTDGYGRSDSRAALRDHFEVDRRWIVVAALQGARRRRHASTARASRSR